MPETRSIAAQTLYRNSTAHDLPAIRQLEVLSSLAGDAGLAEALIAAPIDTLSFVAELEGAVVGHILLTAIAGPQRALALAPLSILPDWRDMQIGTELVRHALHVAREQSWKSVFVYGQPDYYCRFGFKSRTADAADTSLQGPRFLALELSKGALTGWSGPLEYPKAFLERFTEQTKKATRRPPELSKR
ncbi:MAG: GNAT family N-acetyltransferase [Hoeflea sp.]|uniref:GNAT family N-acetyltransferase n=1 Tax=Hoeflea sp. TaxID=1940281 RepID=UPI003EF501F0